eukprot:11917553-Alexandrium_andersonii.AAC.1
MSASLVGSEMCIRDRFRAVAPRVPLAPGPTRGLGLQLVGRGARARVCCPWVLLVSTDQPGVGHAF